jgi:hypothetical protein
MEKGKTGREVEKQSKQKRGDGMGPEKKKGRYKTTRSFFLVKAEGLIFWRMVSPQAYMYQESATFSCHISL